MEKTAVFTISRSDNGINIKSKGYNTYNKYGLQEKQLFDAMAELSDVFNNVIGIAIVFEVD